MNNTKVYIDGKYYRRGYTTGATATAAVVAAAIYAVKQVQSSTVDIVLPNGAIATLPINNVWQDGGAYMASAIKDGGDDIDVTNGLEIIATLRIKNDLEPKGIFITAGKGVGIITKGGLQRAIGDPAINPGPLKMMEDNIRALMGNEISVEITISVPEGEKAALRTFNPRLGIVGGISIIGSTGIVEPMSEEAWKKSLEIELRQKVELGMKELVFVPGNHGEKFAITALHTPEDNICTMSNFVGHLLMEAVNLKIAKVTLVGHIGKLIKVAGGNFHTHNRISDGRIDILCSHLAKIRADYDFIDIIRATNTTDEAVEKIIGTPYEKVFLSLATAAKERATLHTYGEIGIEVVLYDMKGRLLASTEKS